MKNKQDYWENVSFSLFGEMKAYRHRHIRCKYVYYDLNEDGVECCLNCGYKMVVLNENKR